MGTSDTWASGAAYEPYVGRWSRIVARDFLFLLAVAPGRRWLDVGCGTGALTETVLKQAEPAEIIGVDPAEGFVAYARAHVDDGRVSFTAGDAAALPFETGAFDAAVSGLALNFVPQPVAAVTEMTRVVRRGGLVAAYVWDYDGQMQMMRVFWDAAAELDPAAAGLDEGRRFPICRPDPLARLFAGAHLDAVEVSAVGVTTHFRDFDDYWSPFLGGQGPAPSYLMALTQEKRTALRELIRSTLPIAVDGSIRLAARAWAVRGRKR
ncbi:MAG: class I SAM-dependent methyltransferase [Nitrososphaerales archaeon]